MGKTTLAKVVFKEVKEEFDKPIWVSVSAPFEQTKFAKAILEALDKKTPDLATLQVLLERIEESVSGKRFLLILDNVWTEDYKTWEPFKIALQSGSRGSRILVTTRKSTVAEQVMASVYTHELGRLSDSDCCLVLEQRAFAARRRSSYLMLSGVAMDIAKKCDGMPLAAEIIGGLLSLKTSLDDWENVLKSEWWDNMGKGVFPVLALSYQELDPVVKRCFSFCTVFPKGERIEVESLVRIWMAQGFLASNGNIGMERRGREYFRDLEARSMFGDFERDEIDRDRVISFRIHDVVLEFAQSLTKNECLVAEDRADDDKKRTSGPLIHNVHHLNIQGSKASAAVSVTTASLLSSISEEKLHSLLLNHYKVPSDICSHLKRVKWLRLSACLLLDIPKEIGSLIHLRLLDLSRNPFTRLPETICELYHLQTLDISNCVRLSGLPQKIERLAKLTHVPNSLTKSEDFKFPVGFEKLTSLQTLENYCFNKLGYLKDMNQLRGSLTICVTELSELEAERADLKSKRFVREVTLKVKNVDHKVIELLRPHHHLQTLDILAQKIPSWLTDNLNNLRKLTMHIYSMDKRTESLPCLGRLHSLEHLRMDMMYEMKHIGKEFLGIDGDHVLPESFPKLKRLIFSHCAWWEEWDDITEDEECNNAINIFPGLEELVVLYCQKLKALPVRLLCSASSMKHMKIVSCPLLSRRYKEEDVWDFSSHIPHVEFL